MSFLFICTPGGAGTTSPPQTAPTESKQDVQRASGFVGIHNHRFELDGHAFIVRGTNYFGGWRAPTTFDVEPDLKFSTIWAIYRDWTQEYLSQDFQFLHSRLNATVVRIGTPALSDFANLVRYNGYKPWYTSDGTVTDDYANQLRRLADAALVNGVRIQFCLLWSLGHEIEADPQAFLPGGKMDLFSERQVRSVAAILRDHPGVLGYSIGNEALVVWNLNGTHPSWYEPRAAGFMLRRMRDLKTAAPRQLITIDEGAAPDAKQWYAPSPEFARIPDVDGSNGGQTFRLIDHIDYVGAHFYPEHFNAADLMHPEAKVDDAARQLVPRHRGFDRLDLARL